MSLPLERPGSELTPDAARLVDTYFARVHGALLVAAVGECEEEVGDLRTHVLEELSATEGTVADVTTVLARLGTPEALAAQCADVALEGASPPERIGRGRSLLSGRILGMPYELRLPTPERVALRWWDPLNPRIFVPRLFGLGWTINFGAVAVLLGLVRPDDEDVPFGQVPSAWLSTALLLPLLTAGVLLVLVAVYQAGMPALVAIHYGIDGMPDRLAGRDAALFLPLCMTLIGLALVGWAWLGGRPALQRIAAGAFATMLAAISVGVYGQQVATAHGVHGLGVMTGGLVACFVLPFGLLVALSRVGRAAEQRRDLEKTSKKGSA